jgi:hypothetical protein
MSQFEFAVVTPSYTPDFDRCKLLARSVQKFVQPATHYIIVTRKDYPLFKKLQGPKTEILVVESLIPRWFFKLPLLKNGWLSFKTPPVRNWILQQIVKLSAGLHLEKDVLIYADGDQSGHFWETRGLCKEYWNPVHLSDAELESFLSNIEPECVAVMISAKAGISPSRYQALLEKYETVLERV